MIVDSVPNIEIDSKAAQTQVPSFFDYSDKHKELAVVGNKFHNIIKPIGGGTTFKYDNEKITFKFDTADYMDPYSLFLQFTVRNMNIQYPLQVDNSAHSFFKRIEVSRDNVLYEKIDHYHIMMSFVNDISKGEAERKECVNEGFGRGYDINTQYKTDNPLKAGNSEPVIQAGNGRSVDGYANLMDAYARGAVTEKKKIIPITVRNGLPSADGEDNDKFTFTIPVHSFILGHGIPYNDYRYIPMAWFQNVEIAFYLNEYAVFIPIPPGAAFNETGVACNGTFMKAVYRTFSLDELKLDQNIYTEDRGLKPLIKVNKMETEDLYDWSTAPKVKEIAESALKARLWWAIDHPVLLYTTYKVTANMTPQVYNFRSTRFTMVKSVSFNIDNPPRSIPITHGLGGARQFWYMTLNNSYKKYGFARNLFKYALPYNEAKLKIGSSEYPPGGMKGSNTSTIGKNNNSQFYKPIHDFKKAIGSSKQMTVSSILSPENCALSASYWDMINNNMSLLVPAVVHGYNEIIGRSIGLIPLELYPYTRNQYNDGIATRGSNVELIFGYESSSDYSLVYPCKEFETFIWVYHDYTLTLSKDNVVINS